MDRDELAKFHALRTPASLAKIAEQQAIAPYRLPEEYVSFLLASNGLNTGDRLVLLEIEEIYGRNSDYEVQAYLPGHVMIGDDSGGAAIVMKAGEPAVYEVGMGVLDEALMEKSADSIEQLLIRFEGKTLSERK